MNRSVKEEERESSNHSSSPNSSQNQFIHSSSSKSTHNNSLALKRQQTPAFLEKLFDILEQENDFHHLITWQPDGNSFIIKKVNEFSEIVLPKYFKHSNIQSYIRQLNMYGFSKTRHDSNHHEFTHKLFQRGRRDLLPLIRRKTQSNGPSKGKPDFHSMQVGKNVKLIGTSLGDGNGNMLISDTNGSSGHGPFHVSSEASSSGADEEMHEYTIHSSNFPFALSQGKGGENSNTISAMESRINLLEKQVGALTEFAVELLKKHDDLCFALQSYAEHFSSFDGLSRQNSLDSANPITELESQQLIERSGANHGPEKFENPVLQEIKDDGPPLKRMKSMDGSANHSISCEQITESISSLEESGEKLAQKRPRTVSGEKRIVNFLDYQTDRFKAALPSFPNPSNDQSFSPNGQTKRRSLSLDLGGLEAITAAAQYLDDRNSDSNNITSDRSAVNWDSYSSILMSRSNTGGALSKSVSYGL